MAPPKPKAKQSERDQRSRLRDALRQIAMKDDEARDLYAALHRLVDDARVARQYAGGSDEVNKWKLVGYRINHLHSKLWDSRPQYAEVYCRARRRAYK